MSRAPKVGDYVEHSGAIARIVSVRPDSATLDAKAESGRPIIVRRERWKRDTQSWAGLHYVSPAEVARWSAAKAADKAWRDAIPEGAKWEWAWRAEPFVAVNLPSRVDTADECDQRAAIYTAVAAWLRAKPDPADLLISPERGEE